MRDGCKYYYSTPTILRFIYYYKGVGKPGRMEVIQKMVTGEVNTTAMNDRHIVYI